VGVREVNVTNKTDLYSNRNFETIFYDNCRNSRASLVNFYGQYANRHMNLKFMQRVSEREREIRQLMSVFNAPVLLLTMGFVITLSK